MKKVSLLIVDPQTDFCLPGASLYVKGADSDMHRLSEFIIENANEIETIHISLDMHLLDSIFHSMYWENQEGKNPEPFTNITIEDVQKGIWKTANPKDSHNALTYLEVLKTKNNFTHTIWPYHCISGTYGSNIFPPLYSALRKWMDITGKSFCSHLKGMESNTEHFGIFQNETDGIYNTALIHELFDKNDNVLVAGQAKSHCVAVSLKQILEYFPDCVKKITLLTDTTSDVDGCEHIADKIYEDLRSAGMKEEITTEYSKKYFSKSK